MIFLEEVSHDSIYIEQIVFNRIVENLFRRIPVTMFTVFVGKGQLLLLGLVVNNNLLLDLFKSSLKVRTCEAFLTSY